MTKQIICPNCRSTLEASGNLNINTRQVFMLPCPVCKAPNYISAGFPAVEWNALKVIKRNEPARTWAQVKEQTPEVAKAIETQPAEFSQSTLKDFQLVPKGLKNFGSGLEKRIGAVMIFVVVVLGLYLAIKFKSKG